MNKILLAEMWTTVEGNDREKKEILNINIVGILYSEEREYD